MSDAFVDNRVKVGSGKQIGVTGRYQCRWCRMPVDARRRSNVGPENQADGNIVETSDGVVTNLEARQGCPFCGRYGWSGTRNPPRTETKLLNRRRVRPALSRSRRRFDRF